MKLKKNLNKFKDLFYRLRNILIVSCSNRHLTAGLIYIDFECMFGTVITRFEKSDTFL